MGSYRETNPDDRFRFEVHLHLVCHKRTVIVCYTSSVSVKFQFI